MPRRSSRAVPTSAPAPKRRASDRISAALKTDPKRPKYNTSTANKPMKTTEKKSKYFEDGDTEDFEVGSESGSAYEETNSTTSQSIEANSGILDESSTDEEIAQKPRARKVQDSGRRTTQRQGRIQKSNISDEKDISDEEMMPSLKDKELLREGVSTGLGPGKEVFIKKPKARSPGKVPYQDHTLHPNTMLFLQDLASHNERHWLKAHDADYRASKKDWETFVESLTEEISKVDSTIPELPAKDLVFRIHRDIRFSKDPTPYKTHFSAAWSRTGKKGPYAAYYVHLQPGSCFVGCGLWNPEADKLGLLREEIDRNSHHLKAVLQRPDMRREIFKDMPHGEERAVQAFVSQNKESALKTKPKGYSFCNVNIELLRLRSFTIGKPLADSELMASNAREKIAAIIAVMEPFVTYLNSVVMPDRVD